MRTIGLVIALALGGTAACSKDAPPAASGTTTTTAPVTAGTKTADGVRKIAVEANIKGYTPGRITAKPGEKVVLVVTRTLEGECLEEIKVAGGTPVKLPMNTAVEIPVTAPASGELAFACGMDMFKGTIVVES